MLCIGPAPEEAAAPEAVEAALREALGRLPLKEAAKEVATAFGLPRRDVYQLGLTFRGDR